MAGRPKERWIARHRPGQRIVEVRAHWFPSLKEHASVCKMLDLDAVPDPAELSEYKTVAGCDNARMPLCTSCRLLYEKRKQRPARARG